jgi:hypothetical protein
VTIGSAIYLFIQRQFVAGVVALIWPVAAGLTILRGQIDVFELRLAKRIGYVAPDSEHPTPMDDGTVAEARGTGRSCATKRRSGRLPSSVRAEFESAARLHRTLTGIRPRNCDYYQSPPATKPLNVPTSYVLTKVYQHGAFLGWSYIDKSAVERLHMAKAQTAP